MQETKNYISSETKACTFNPHINVLCDIYEDINNAKRRGITFVCCAFESLFFYQVGDLDELVNVLAIDRLFLLHRNQFNELLRIPASFTFIIHRVVYNLSKGIVNSSTLQSYCIPFIRKQDDLLCRKGILNVLNVSTDYTIFNDLTTLG